MIVDGAIEARGVLPPEQAVPHEPFFRELKRRGMSIRRRTRRLDGRRMKPRPSFRLEAEATER